MRSCVFARHLNITTTLLASNEGQMQNVSPPLLSLPMISFQLTSVRGQDEISGAEVRSVRHSVTSLPAKRCVCCRSFKLRLPCNEWVPLSEKCSTSIRLPVRIMFEQAQQAVAHRCSNDTCTLWDLLIDLIEFSRTLAAQTLIFHCFKHTMNSGERVCTAATAQLWRAEARGILRRGRKVALRHPGQNTVWAISGCCSCDCAVLSIQAHVTISTLYALRLLFKLVKELLCMALLVIRFPPRNRATKMIPGVIWGHTYSCSWYCHDRLGCSCMQRKRVEALFFFPGTDTVLLQTWEEMPSLVVSQRFWYKKRGQGGSWWVTFNYHYTDKPQAAVNAS